MLFMETSDVFFKHSVPFMQVSTLLYLHDFYVYTFIMISGENF